MVGRDREVGQAQLAERQLQVGHLGDAPGVRERLGQLAEEGLHLGGGLQVEVRRLEAHPPGGVDVRAGADAEEDVVRLRLGPVDVVEVVRRDEREPDLGTESHELLVERTLLRQAVVLDLEVEAVRPEDVRVAARELPGRGPVVVLECARDLTVQAGREPDEARAVLGEVVAVDPRLVVVAVDMGIGDDPAEVLVAGPVAGQQDQVEGLRVRLAFAVGHAAARDVRLHADDRLDAAVDARLVEGDRAVERAVIRDREAVEALRGRLADQLVDPAEAVEEAELRVDVEVCEVVRGDRHGRAHGTRQRRMAAWARAGDAPTGGKRSGVTARRHADRGTVRLAHRPGPRSRCRRTLWVDASSFRSVIRW